MGHKKQSKYSHYSNPNLFTFNKQTINHFTSFNMRLALIITTVSLIGCFHSKSIGEGIADQLKLGRNTRKELLNNAKVATQNLVEASQNLVDKYGKKLGVSADLKMTMRKLTPVVKKARKNLQKTVETVQNNIDLDVQNFQKNRLPELKKEATDLASNIESKSPVKLDSIGYMVDDAGLEAFKALKFVPTGLKKPVENLIEEGMKTLKKTMEKRTDVDWDNTDPQDVAIEAKNSILEGFKQSKVSNYSINFNKIVVDMSEKAVAGSQQLTGQ